MEAITTAITNATTAFGGIWDMITGNPLALVLVCFTVLGAAIGCFSRLKRSAAN